MPDEEHGSTSLQDAQIQDKFGHPSTDTKCRNGTSAYGHGGKEEINTRLRKSSHEIVAKFSATDS